MLDRDVLTWSAVALVTFAMVCCLAAAQRRCRRPQDVAHENSRTAENSGRDQMAKKWVDGFRGLGKFNLPSQKDVYGEVVLDGNDSILVLLDVDRGRYGLEDPTVHGVIDQTAMLSLFDCIAMRATRSVDSQGTPSKYRLEIFPHHILFGQTHVGDNDALFTSISFVLTDAINLFYDFDAFGTVIHPDALIDPILAAQSNIGGREITKGEHPEIAYFTGRHTIIEVPTDIGKISAQNLPSISLGGPQGSGFVNSIWVEIDFSAARTFNDAIEPAYALEPFFSMIAGRPQRMEEMRLLAPSSTLDGPPSPLDARRSAFGGLHGDLAALGVHFDKPRRAPAMIRRDGRRGFCGLRSAGLFRDVCAPSFMSRVAGCD
ncbi:ApeA N-terminal domain 1-containing protein [Mesorhizobium cantuariense]|uniref:ApeA N-terminal domain-containing protein n=1 Tax=Mesorhizobium cantuariense TaxID=1300275 RepID=A0ABV7MXB3_9HYPH